MNATAWQAVWKDLLVYLPRLPVGAAILIGFWAGGRVLQGIIVRFGAARRADSNLISFLGRSAKVIAIVFGIITTAGTLGIDVTSLVAGLGLTGLTLGLALKDSVSNAVSGILLIVYKPFASHDRIAMATFEGTVMEINLRYTVLDTGEKKVFIPNSLLFTTPITVQGPQTIPSQPTGPG